MNSVGASNNLNLINQQQALGISAVKPPPLVLEEAHRILEMATELSARIQTVVYRIVGSAPPEGDGHASPKADNVLDALSDHLRRSEVDLRAANEAIARLDRAF